MGKYKHDEGNYFQMWKKGIQNLNVHNKKVPYSTRWLYTHLHWLEHFYYSAEIDGFYRSVRNLQKDMKMGRRQVIEGIKILENLKLIETWQMPVIDKKTGKRTDSHITAFRILEP